MRKKLKIVKKDIDGKEYLNQFDVFGTKQQIENELKFYQARIGKVCFDYGHGKKLQFVSAEVI